MSDTDLESEVPNSGNTTPSCGRDGVITPGSSTEPQNDGTSPQQKTLETSQQNDGTSPHQKTLETSQQNVTTSPHQNESTSPQQNASTSPQQNVLTTFQEDGTFNNSSSSVVDTTFTSVKTKSVIIVAPGDEIPKANENEDKKILTEVDEEAQRRRGVLRRELTQMQEKEENRKLMQNAARKAENKKAVAKAKKERIEKGIAIHPEARSSKKKLKELIGEEDKLAAWEEKSRLADETAGMKQELDHKLGISVLPKGKELMGLADEFFNEKEGPFKRIPEHIRRQLTTTEINDFRVVFELFDTKNKGYITAIDLERVAGLFGYTSKRRVFKEMIQHSGTEKRGRVSFINFLDLVVKLQGDGPDPFEDIQRAFRQMDRGNKGYLTMADLRAAADELKVPLSNTAMREMMLEADRSGDGKISLDEFCYVIKQTGSFRSVR